MDQNRKEEEYGAENNGYRGQEASERQPLNRFVPAPTASLDEWKRMQLIYSAALKEVNTKLEILNAEFQMAHRYNPIEHLSARIKSPESIAKKLRHQGRAVTVENIVRYINDVAGIRIICSFTSDIYKLSELIRKQSDVKVLKIKDYIENPKPNGYTSYHMINIAYNIFYRDCPPLMAKLLRNTFRGLNPCGNMFNGIITMGHLKLTV